MGTREIFFSREIYIDKEDFNEEAPNNKYNLNRNNFNSSAQNQSQNAEKTGRKLGNQVIRKGYMSIHNLGIMKGIGMTWHFGGKI